MRYLFILSLIFVCGCSPFRAVRHIVETPTVEVMPNGQVKVGGDAQTPSNVNSKKSDGRLTIPEGSRFEFNEKLGTMTLVISKTTEMAVNRTETAVQGPVAFTPDKGPTIGEEFAAKSDFWTTIGLRAGVAIGAALGIFGLVRNWNYVMYGGTAICGACLFGLFVQKNPIILIIVGLGAAAAIIGPIIWHTKLKKLEPPPPA